MEPILTGAAAPTRAKPTHPLTYAALAVVVAGTILFLWQSATSYEVYKALHIVAAVVWVGGGTAFTVMALIADRAGARADMPVIAKYADWFGLRVFTPSSIVVLGFGIAMVEKAGWGWGRFWIDFALAAWALSFLIGLLLLAPLAKKIHTAYEESRGETTDEIVALIDRIILIARFDVAMLLLIVVDMAAKPSF